MYENGFILIIYLLDGATPTDNRTYLCKSEDCSFKDQVPLVFFLPY